MVQTNSFTGSLGKHTPATSLSNSLPLKEIVPFISNAENRHGRTWQVPGSQDSVTSLTDGQKVWFGVASHKELAGLQLIGEKGNSLSLIKCPHPAQLPTKIGDPRIWWQASRVRVLPTCKIRLIYKN